MRYPIPIAAAVGFVLLCSTARADLAPTTFDGLTFSPVDHTEIRMDSELVEITLGPRISEDNTIRTAHVTGHFRMVNDSSDTLAVKVGFPVFEEFALGSRMFSAPGVYEFRVSVDGSDWFAPDTSWAKGAYSHRRPARHLWFGWTMPFAPGPTFVDVEYDIRSSYSYKAGFQNLYYTVYSGRFWKGTIGHADIRVVFPDDITAGMIMPGTAVDHRIHGRTIQWIYDDYEPEMSDRIRVEYIPPDLAREMTNLQIEHRRLLDVRGAPVPLRLAEIYLELGALGTADPRYPDFNRMAEPYLRSHLAREPGDARVWNLWLTRYSRMHAGTFGLLWFNRFPFSEEQREVIARAHESCRGDRRISLWYAIATDTLWQIPDTLGHLEDTRWSWKNVLIPDNPRAWDSEVPLGGASWAVVRLEAPRVAFVERFYDRHAAMPWPLLVRNSRPVSPEDCRRFRTLFHDAHLAQWTHELGRLNREAGIR